MRAGITVLAAILAAGSFSAFGANTKSIKHAKKPVPSSYVVVLEERIIDDPESILEELAKKHDVRFKRNLAPLLKAGHFQMNRAQAEAVLADERVAGVWEDAEVDIAATVVPRSWNLDRIDDRLAPRLDASYHYCSTGRGVRAYIVDTGIWGSHDEFSNPDPITGLSRVPLGYDRDATNHSNDPLCNRSLVGDTFLYGGSHGTAVASVLGGRTLGVAPDVTLVPVRVLNCESKGSFSDVILGLNWIMNENVPAGTKRVVNMSFTITLVDPNDLTKHPLELAIDGLIGQGISVVVAAGNDNTSTAFYTPARYGPAIVAGGSKGRNATDVDSRWNDGPTGNPGSNYGTSIDLFAPADRVMVAQWTGPTATRNVEDNRWSSGTSFAAPAVAGAIARNLQMIFENNDQMTARLTGQATSDVDGLNLLDRMNSPNKLLFIFNHCKQRSCC